VKQHCLPSSPACKHSTKHTAIKTTTDCYHAILVSIILFVCTLNSQQTFAQTTLAQGDLSIVGFNSNSYSSSTVNNGFAFVCWVNIANGTTIKFTANAFNSTSPANTAGNAYTGANAIIYWNNNTGSSISAGTVITIGGQTSSTVTTNVGTITGYGTSGYGGNGSTFILSTSGRPLFAFQYSGTDDYNSHSPTATFNGNLLYGLCYAGSSGSSAWMTSGTAGTSKSYKPSDLSSSYQVNGLGALVRYASYTGAVSGFATLNALKAAVNNVSNWASGTSTSGYAAFPGNFMMPASNTAPTFTSGTTTLSVCQNASATIINSLLTVSDADASQTETWSVIAAPSHGTLGGFNTTAASGSTSITPAGLTYTPTNGYNGSDAFTIQVSDGTATATRAITVTINPLTTISSASNQTHDVGSASGNYTDGSCNIISTVQPSGANPVTGNVTAKIWIESSVPVFAGQPYVARHYEITPVTNASTATGTVTLYFLQSEFNAFNAAPGSTLKLPTGSSDAAGIANLRIGKYSGTSSDNSGLPATYTNGAIVIDPTDANIVWNASAGRWEVTFNVSGFSGFIAQTSTSVLPVTWMSFTAEKDNEKVLLKWKTAQENNSSHFVIEHSIDGRHFTAVGSVAASGTSNRPVSYSFVHDAPQKEINYYRLLQADRDGNKDYSVIRMINFATINNGITILVNPVRDGQLQVQFDKAANSIIYDARGRIMMKLKTVPGSQVIPVSNLPRGIYLLQAGSQGRKFIKE
jgi:VCBS repeat-containing protein